MALPIINPATRPIDYVGAALEAFSQVSGEFRADRQMGMQERETAQRMGMRQKESILSDARTREELIDTAIQRRYAEEDQRMQIEKFQFEMSEAAWERENIAPLEMDVLRTRADANRALAESRRYQVNTEGQLQGQFGQEFNAVNGLINDLRQGPAEGEDEAAYLERVRTANAALSNLDKTWGKVKNPAVPSALAGAKSLLYSTPGYRLLQDRDDLATADERAMKAERRQAAMIAMLPFRSDADKDKWMSQNRSRLDAWMKLDDDTFGTAIKAEADRLKDDPEYGKAASATVDLVAKRAMERDIQEAEIAVIAARRKIEAPGTAPLDRIQAETDLRVAQDTLDFLRRRANPEAQSVLDRARAMPVPRSPGQVRAAARAADPLEFTPPGTGAAPQPTADPAASQPVFDPFE